MEMQPDENTKAYKLLRKTGLEGGEANELVNIIGNMASTNIIERFEAKLESNMDSVDAKFEAINSILSSLRWFIGIGIALIIASNFIG